MFSSDLAIDLGTANTLVFAAENRASAWSEMGIHSMTSGVQFYLKAYCTARGPKSYRGPLLEAEQCATE